MYLVLATYLHSSRPCRRRPRATPPPICAAEQMCSSQVRHGMLTAQCVKAHVMLTAQCVKAHVMLTGQCVRLFPTNALPQSPSHGLASKPRVEDLGTFANPFMLSFRDRTHGCPLLINRGLTGRWLQTIHSRGLSGRAANGHSTGNVLPSTCFPVTGNISMITTWRCLMCMHPGWVRLQGSSCCLVDAPGARARWHACILQECRIVQLAALHPPWVVAPLLLFWGAWI